MRWIGCLVVGLVVALLPPAPSYAAPPLTIRVPHVAQADAVPPAVVVAPAGEELAGTPYVVKAGDVPKLEGELAEVDGSAAPWSQAALAEMENLPAGTYTVEVLGTSSVPFTVADTAYSDVLASLLPIYDANADGEVASTYHGPSHLHDARSTIANGPRKGERVDVMGGWMDAGDQLKFTTTIAFSTLMLDLAARNQQDARSELRRVATIGIDWLRRAHPRRGVFVAQVGHVAADHNAGFRDPTVDDDSADPRRSQRPSYVLTRRSGGSDVAGIAAAALALRADTTTNDIGAAALVRRAEEWLALALDLKAPWRNCCYQQDSWWDDIALARAELWRATGEQQYARGAVSALKKATANGDEPWRVSADGYDLAAIAAAELCGELGLPVSHVPDVSRPACRILRQGAENWLWVQGQDAFGRAGANQWGSVRQAASGALVLHLGFHAGINIRQQRDRAVGWLLGVNPWGLRWQVGVPGGISNPYHWTTGIGVPPPPGALPGGPTRLRTINDNRCDTCEPIVAGPFDTPALTYQDDPDDWVMNEIGISYNAPAVLLLALLQPD